MNRKLLLVFGVVFSLVLCGFCMIQWRSHLREEAESSCKEVCGFMNARCVAWRPNYSFYCEASDGRRFTQPW